jgi:hypothetical protein
MLVKTLDYLDHFARFKRKENVEAVERLLSAHKELAGFERAQLGTVPLYLHAWIDLGLIYLPQAPSAANSPKKQKPSSLVLQTRSLTRTFKNS